MMLLLGAELASASKSDVLPLVAVHTLPDTGLGPVTILDSFSL